MPTAAHLLAVSVVARLPLATFTIGVLVHVEHLTGSYAVAGLAAGALAVAQGLGGPLLGRRVDRRGQTGTLVASALVAGAALGGLAALPAGAPVPAIVAVAAVLGLATPPVSACLRTLLPALAPAPMALRRAYAVDAAAVELTWAAGPPLVLLAGAAWSTGAALAAAGAVLAIATVLFAAAPASRRWRPAPPAARRAGALRTPAMRTLVVVLAGVGVLFGAVEVGVTSAADALEHSAAAGPLLGLWGAGSLLGGIVAARLGGGARTGPGLAFLLAALAAGHLALAWAADDLVALAILIAVAGSLIAPTLATAYAMVDRAAPAGTVTEAFAWLATAVAVGTSAGAATAGALADAAGPLPAFVLAGGGAAVATVVAALRAGTLSDPRPVRAATLPAAVAA